MAGAEDLGGSRTPHSGSRRLAAAESGWLGWGGLLVLAVTAWRLYALWVSDIDLFFDEAQYWYWAQDPDFGYFSKPPLLAWLIAGSTALFGDSEFGIRALSPLCYGVTAAFGGGIAYRLYSAHAAQWTAAMLVLLPGVSVSATIVSTDVPLLLCWSAALYCWVRYAQEGGLWWIGLGAALGLGLLAKYAMSYLVVGLAATALMAPSYRQVFCRGGFWAALLLAVLLFAPNIWWNYANDFVSFGHTADNANWTAANLKPHKMAEFVGAQFGVFGPVLMIAFIWALVRWRRLTEAGRLLAAFALPVLALMIVQSFISRAHANWAAVAYISATVLVTGWLLRIRLEGWLKVSLVLHLAVAAAVLHGASLAPLTGTDPWHRQRGWTEMAAEVRNLLDAHPDAVLLAGDRKIAASMMYYVRPHPWDMVKWNPDGRIDGHYELVSSHDELAGRPAILLSRTADSKGMSERFGQVERLGTVSRARPTRPPEIYHAFLLRDYRGRE